MLRSLWGASRLWWSRIAGGGGVAGPRGIVGREARFELEVPAIYRRKGGLVWYDGGIENISLNGVLWRGEKAIPPDEQVEVSFRVPEGAGTPVRGEIFLWGKIVRTEPRPIAGAHVALAARVLRYRRDPQLAPDIRKMVGEVRGPLKSI